MYRQGSHLPVELGHSQPHCYPSSKIIFTGASTKKRLELVLRSLTSSEGCRLRKDPADWADRTELADGRVRLNLTVVRDLSFGMFSDDFLCSIV